MDAELPAELAALLDADDPESREEAWSAFLERYSRVLLKAAQRFGTDYDATMDRYRYILECLSKDDFRRLRSYEVRSRSRFRSWLAVVARRLCLDHERSRYGRSGRAADSQSSEHDRGTRRRVIDLVGAMDPADLPHPDHPDPERQLRQEELRRALASATANLDPRDRLLLKLRFDDGLSVQQIADVMQFPTVFHVYRRLKSLLGNMRRDLRARGVGDPAP